MDIHKDPFSDEVRRRLINDGYPIEKILNHHDFFEFVIFTNLIDVQILKEYDDFYKRESWKVRLILLDKPTQYRDIAEFVTEAEAWDRGMVSTIRWLNSNKRTGGRYGRNDRAYTEMFSEFNAARLESLKSSLYSHSSTTKPFMWETYLMQPEMAKRLISYCDKMLSITTPRIPAVVIEASSPDSTTIDATNLRTASTSSVWIIDDLPNPTVATTVTTASNVTGQQYYTVNGPVTPPVPDPEWSREEMLGNYSLEFINYMDREIGELVEHMMESEIYIWMERYDNWIRQQDRDADRIDYDENGNQVDPATIADGDLDNS